MFRADDILLRETIPAGSPLVEEELPLKVVPDWDEKVRQAENVCRLIDKHLNFEAKGRLLFDDNDFRPGHLCPEQRVQMVSDLYAATMISSTSGE